MSRTLIAAAALTAGGVLGSPAAVAAPAAPAAAAVRPSVTTSYLAATHTGRTARLQLVDRRTGVVTRTLATAVMKGANNPFTDAGIAPDGTVWAVSRQGGPYSSTLLRIKDGRVNTVMPYVASARISPDGTRLAVTVLSPDVNHDGRGTRSVRVGSVTGRGMRTIAQETFPVDAQGQPAVEYQVPHVQTWLGNHHLALWHGCCDDGNVSVISADRVSTPSAWPGRNGDASTEVVGVRGDTAVVPVAVTDRDGSPVRYDVYHLSPAHPRGVRAGQVGVGRDGTMLMRPYLLTIGAAATVPEYAALPYRATKGVTLDRTFTGR
ncbi:hypothetical protein [Arsenicicoccus dermatophilus]|uniref:hypothetical protein n=1 Tax=Arsenicicoccus dermatophilus TaxID=1076331 RepID=UPI001F4D31F6|nr:hypothetical protein [Arsenicicoccus dermatophilus]MCH8614032.1 hypothetical protein [Arsenicicoccus dermatophilus]